jgi:hypothetical protein
MNITGTDISFFIFPFRQVGLYGLLKG